MIYHHKTTGRKIEVMAGTVMPKTFEKEGTRTQPKAARRVRKHKTHEESEGADIAPEAQEVQNGGE